MRPLFAALALCAFGCSSGGDDDGTGLGCGFVRDQENCWRVFVRAVDACLGEIPVGSGAMTADRKSCTWGGRTITSNNATEINDTKKQNIARNFTVTAGGRACMQVVETDTTLEVTSEGKKISYAASNGAISLTCPNGTKQTGTFDRLYDCLTYDGGVPGTAISSSETRGVYRLLGMRGPAYDCTVPKSM